MWNTECIQSKEMAKVPIVSLNINFVGEDKIDKGKGEDGVSIAVMDEDSLSLLRPHIGEEIIVKSSQEKIWFKGIPGYPDDNCISSQKCLEGVLEGVDSQGILFLINKGKISHIAGGYISPCEAGRERIVYKRTTGSSKEESLETEKINQIITNDTVFQLNGEYKRNVTNFVESEVEKPNK
ncbi:MAG: hypothetical protein PHX34_05390 [Candidatus Shapirobacteria bacterium]|nr:hypothetical protein [Candidatus Shapirobacteria bacterium]